MGSGRRCSLLLLLLLLLPAARGDCGPLPSISHAEPRGDSKEQQSFSVGSTVTFGCVPGYTRLPLLPDTIRCLPNSRWSSLQEFCGRSCPRPPSVPFAAISPQDQRQNFYAVNTTVRYVCRQGFENTTDQPPASTCLDNLTWTEVPRLCQKKSCGIPADPEHGQVTVKDHLLGATASVVCDPGYGLKGASPSIRCLLQGDKAVWSPLPACQAKTTAETNQTEPSEENPYWLASILIPSCIVPPVVLGILAGIVVRRKESEKHSYQVNLQKQEVRGRDAAAHPGLTEEKKQPKPWNSYFCHAGNCHVCPGCEEQLHGELAPLSEPPGRGCPACQAWLSSRPHRAHSVPSVGEGDSQSPSSSPAKAVDVPGEAGPGGAAARCTEAEQPRDHQSDHICPTCESWLRAHTGQGDSRAVTPGEWQDQGPAGPLCPPCTDRQLLSLVRGDTARSPLCPLAGEGTPAHLAPPHSPGCHLCPVCRAPSHAHLCQPRRPADQSGAGQGGAVPSPLPGQGSALAAMN